MIERDPQHAAAAFQQVLQGVKRILVLSHVNPDGDAIGSTLGLTFALRAAGYEAIPLAVTQAPTFCDDLPGIEVLQTYRPGSPLPAVDLIWMVDTAEIQRVGPVFSEHAERLRQGPLCIVDHHFTNDGSGGVNLIDHEAASCAELLFKLITALALPLPPLAATWLLLGITTDTQSFQTTSTRSESLRIAAELIDQGADQQAIIRALYFSTPLPTMRLSALAVSAMRFEDGLAWTVITQEMIAAAHADDESSEDVVGRLQRLEGVKIAAIFKERHDGVVKLSLRSTPQYDVSALCRIWGGGGHRQAAGATLPFRVAQLEAEVVPVLRAALD